VSDLKLICHIDGSQTETSLFADPETSEPIAETENDERAGRRGRDGVATLETARLQVLDNPLNYDITGAKLWRISRSVALASLLADTISNEWRVRITSAGRWSASLCR
jgi:hypothetical protein